MKTSTNHFSLPLAAALLAGATLFTPAHAWQTVYGPLTGGLTGVSGHLGTDAAGNVYAAGRYLAPDGSSIAIVLGSGDQGNTWALVDEYAEAGRSYAHNRAFAADQVNGNLFAGGNVNNLLPNGTYEYDTLWFIREWDPQTGTWFTAEDSSNLINDVGEASCADLLVTPAGDVFATGGGQQLGWLVRKRAAGASMFTTVDVDYSGKSSGAGWGMAFHPTRGLFVVGEVNGRWTVRRSASGDWGTWTTVDSISGGARSAVVTASGAIHVAGWITNRGKRHWVVRTSTDGGITWKTTDDVKPAGDLAEPTGMSEDGAGNILVCGWARDASGKARWLVRQGTVVTNLVKKGKNWVEETSLNWTTIEDYSGAADGLIQARANSIAADPTGNIYVSGVGGDALNNAFFIVRRLPQP